MFPLTDVAIAAEHLSKSFDGVPALRNVSLAIARGRVHCLLGENGSGKSTLIKLFSGVQTPDSGTIIIDEQSHVALNPRAAIEYGLHVIYQDLALLPNMTVGENIALPVQSARGKLIARPRDTRMIGASILEELGVSIPLDVRVGDLPVAFRQLVAISRALVEEARVVFMDEPTASLTSREVNRLLTIVRGLTGRGIAIVFVTHKLEEALSVSEDITVLRDGAVVASGRAADFDRDRLVRTMTGQVEATHRCQFNVLDKAALEVRNLGADRAFEDISFTLRYGEIIGITGLLGSGNSELGEALFGLRPTMRGRVLVEGVERQIRRPRDALGAGIGYVPADRLMDGLFPRLSVGKNIVAADLEGLATRWGLLRRHVVRDAARRLITQLSIKTASTLLPAAQLSGGNQQRVVLAKWLLRDTGILILNSPTVGVDVGSKQELLGYLQELSAGGRAILVISEDLVEMVQICNRVLVMRSGRIVSDVENSGGMEAIVRRDIYLK
jgi:simple sugar transport system ATP-binding protein